MFHDLKIEKVAWKGNSRYMYLAVKKNLPVLLQGGLDRLVLQWMLKNKIDSVTEDAFFEILRSFAPVIIQEKIFPKLDKMRSSPVFFIRPFQRIAFTLYLRFKRA